MTERQVTIAINVAGASAAASQLGDIIQQRNELMAKQKINLRLDTGGLDQAKRAAAQAQAASASAIRDMSLLGSAISSKAIAPLQQYQNLLGSVMHAGKSIGPGLVSALGSVSAELQRQRTLAAFWGASGYMHQGVNALKSSLSGFLSGSGTGFTSWLQSASANLTQYRTALTVAAAAMVGMAAAAALSSKHSQNLISSMMDSKLMGRKFGEDGSARKEDALKWIESAQGNDLVIGGRETRAKTLQTVLSKNRAIGGEQAKKVTEDIEKYFYANQEELQGKGIASAADLASKISTPQLTGEDASFFEDKFGLGFSNISATARLSRLGVEAQGIDPEKEKAKRPDVVLSERVTKTTQAMGDAVLPVLNTVLNGFIKLSDIIGAIPGLGAALGWGAVLMGAATAGLVVVSMLGSIIPGIVLMKNAVMGETAAKYANIAATYAHAAASKVAAAGQWLLNAAMSANPLGIAIIAIAALVAGLYYLETQFGVVTKAWKLFSESSIGKGVFAAIADGKKAIEDLLGTLGRAYKAGGVGGVLKVALEGIVANSPILKLVAFMVDFLRKLWTNSNILNKLFAAGMAIWAKMTDFFTWLLDTIKGGLAWIKDGLGITKKEIAARTEQTATRIGLAHGKVDSEGKGIPYEYMTVKGSGTGWFPRGTSESSDLAPNEGLTPLELTQLTKGKLDVEKAPKGVFEGIPGIDLLTTAIGTLITTLENFKFPEYPAGTPGAAKVTVNAVAAGAGALGNNLINPSQYNPLAVPNAIAGAIYDYVAGGEQPAGQGQERPDKATWIADQIKQNPALSQENAEASYNHNYPPMARGGQIRATGSLIGHASEEMDPAQVVAGGKTTLARINEMFSGMFGGAGMSGGAGSGQPITVNSSITVNVAKMDSKADVKALAAQLGEEFDDKLLFRIRNKLDATSLRGIGYMRG